MVDAGIGRLLISSLHQGIADVSPSRLEFYENWLNVSGLREGTIGLAPLFAVLSFLRTEGDAYKFVTAQAGEVLRATARIPFGNVSTYREIATDAGSPKAYRAAGNALGSNDGVFKVPVTGPERGHVKAFLSVPKGAECCGPLHEGTTTAAFG